MAASTPTLWTMCVTLVVTLIPLVVYSNPDGDALYALRQALVDPDNVIESLVPRHLQPSKPRHSSVVLSLYNFVLGDLPSKNLSGNLVPELGKLDALQYLVLNENKIQGTIPTELGNLGSLISLDLYQNDISGAIPPSLGNLKSLLFLRVNDNRLTCPIPKSLEGISGLRVLNLSNNYLCGTIPTGGSFPNIIWKKYSLTPINKCFDGNPRLGAPCS